MASSETSKKSGRSKKSIRSNPDRFNPPGLDFRGKLIGVEDVPEARGDKMCQVAIAKLKAAVRTIGDHKQRIVVNVTFDGIKIVDEKTEEVLHRHIVQRISFIARDVSDTRAFGYVYASTTGRHLFYGIKTEKVAEGIVLCLRDLFQIVFDRKKHEIEAAKQACQMDVGLKTGSSLLNSQRSSSCGSSGEDREEGMIQFGGELDSLGEGLDQLNTYAMSHSTSPGGNSWPLASSMWDSTALPSNEEKYNTLPTGSVTIYRSMFGSGPRTARTAAFKMEQSTPVSETLSQSSQSTSATFSATGASPRVRRSRNHSLTSVTELDTYVIPPPASIPSARRVTGATSRVVQGNVPATKPETVTPLTSTGWAKFDLSPLAENAQDIPIASDTVTDAFPDQDVFQPSTLHNTVEVITSSHGFTDFADAEVLKENGSFSDGNIQTNSNELSKKGQFADSFVANSFSFDDSIRPNDNAAATTTLDLMSPSSDRDSLSLPSPEAPPPPLPADIVAVLPPEPPIPPPRPIGKRDRCESLSCIGNLDVSKKQPGVSQSITLFAPDKVIAGMNLESMSDTIVNHPLNARLTAEGFVFPFEFPSDDLAPPPPPRPAFTMANIDGYRSLPRPGFKRGISVPSGPKVSLVASSTSIVPPAPPTRRSVTNCTPVADSSIAQISRQFRAAKLRQKQSSAASPVLSNVGITETTITPLPRPRPQLRSTEVVVGVSDAVVRVKGGQFESPTFTPSAPSFPVESEVNSSLGDPFLDVDPFANNLGPDDPFVETLSDRFLTELSHNFESTAMPSQTFRTRAVTVDSVSSDVFDGDFGTESAHPRSSNSRSSDCSLRKPGTPQKRVPQTNLDLLIDLNASIGDQNLETSPKEKPLAVLLESAQFGDVSLPFDFNGKLEHSESHWVRFQGPVKPENIVVRQPDVSTNGLSSSIDQAVWSETLKTTKTTSSADQQLFPVGDSFS